MNISDIYNVLTGNWFTKMDKNEDGIIIKAEFTEFLENNIKGWNGTQKATKDLVDQFWSKFDINRRGDNIKGTTIRNYNALDSRELDEMNKSIENYSKVKVFFDEALKKFEMQMPDDLKGKYLLQWKDLIYDDLYTSLYSYYEEYRTANNFDELIKKINDGSIIENRFNAIKFDYSIEPYASQYLDDLAIKDVPKTKNYVLTDELLNNIRQAVNNIEPDKLSYVNINSTIKSVIDNFDVQGYFNIPVVEEPVVVEPEPEPEIEPEKTDYKWDFIINEEKKENPATVTDTYDNETKPIYELLSMKNYIFRIVDGYKRDINDAIENAKETIVRVTDEFANILINTYNYDSSVVNFAKTTTKNFYFAVLDQEVNIYYRAKGWGEYELNINYEDANGNIRNEKTNRIESVYDGSQKAAGDKRDKDKRTNRETDSGIVLASDKVKYTYYVNIGTLYEKFFSFM